MAVRVLTTDRFNGGISSSAKEGVSRSVAFGRSLDFRTDPSELRILPRTEKDSGSTVVDLVHWAERANDTTYFYGDAGHIYSRTSGGSWSDLRTVSNSSGNGLKYFTEDDYLYYALDSVIGRYGLISGTPSFTDDYFSDDTFDLDQALDTSGNTYTLTTSINEGATHKQSFVPTKDPQKAVEVNISAKGTGNWTCTVHDASDTEVAALTIANASLASSGDQKFTFSSVWRPVIGATYHFHLTSTVADGSVVTTTSADLETADFHTYFQVLVTDTEFHPIEQITNQLAIGNERYLATWDAITYDPHRLSFPPGYTVRCLALVEEYLAIGVWRGNALKEATDGKVFFWDGTSDTYNFYFDVPAGAPHMMISDNNRLLILAGNRGELFAWGSGRLVKVKRIPKTTDQTFTIGQPGGITNFQGITHFGVAFDSDNTSIEKGVYSWGQPEKNYPEVLNYDYPISSGTRTGTGLDIGVVQAFGPELYIGWKDGATYGVDLVDEDNNPFTTATIERLRYDQGKPWKDKQALKIVANHEALASGDSVQLKYKIDRAGSWTSGTANTTSGSTKTELPVNKRFREFQDAIDLAATSNGPIITSIALEFEDLADEEIV